MKHRRHSAFTLLEVLLAASIMAVSAGAVAGVLRAARDAQERASTSAFRRAQVRSLLRHVAADLMATVPPDGVDAAGLYSLDQDAASGHPADELTLSLLPRTLRFGDERPLGHGPIASATWYVDDDPETEEVGLCRQLSAIRDPLGDDPFVIHQVDDQVLGLDLAFYDGEAWVESWDSGASDLLPAAVSLSLTWEDAATGRLTRCSRTVALPSGRTSEPLTGGGR
jgi:type II secretion system protein J